MLQELEAEREELHKEKASAAAEGYAGLWLAGNEGKEKNMETTIVGLLRV